MDFEQLLLRILLSSIIFFRRVIRLLISPYKTMRAVAKDNDIVQLVFILVSIGGYFYIADKLRQYEYRPLLLFGLTIINFLLTAGFFMLLRMIVKNETCIKIKPVLLLFGYSLIPTLLWFSFNSLLYYFLPPPRTISILGKGFSIVYISFSIGVLLWKILVMYLAVRFATRFTFFRIVYSMLIYIACVIPYAFFLYSLRLFRIPFL